MTTSACRPGRPAATSGTTAPGSGVGPLGKRPDLAVLVVVLVFGAFANAAGMVGPVLAWRDRLSSFLGQPSPLLVTSLFYFFGLLVLPLLAVGGAAVLSRRWGRLAASWFEVATRYSYALVPLGFSMWLAHYSFHLLTSYDTVVPAAQRFAARPRLVRSWTAAVGGRLLPPRGGLAAAPGGPLPRPGTAAVAVHRLSHCPGPVAADCRKPCGRWRRGHC